VTTKQGRAAASGEIRRSRPHRADSARERSRLLWFQDERRSGKAEIETSSGHRVPGGGGADSAGQTSAALWATSAAGKIAR